MKKLLSSLVIVTLLLLNIGAVEELDVETNACNHNNLGVNYMNEQNYYGAIKEFEIAIQINPQTQATSVYYNNLGRTYILVGQYKLAQICFENAIRQNPMNFDNYELLASTYKKRGILDAKLKEFKAKKGNPLNDIMVGLIYIQKGQVATGKTTLDLFCSKEPTLLVTVGVKNYLKSKQKKPKYSR